MTFDTVNHGVLLRKLELCGVRGAALRWLTSYLRDRKQFVCISGQYSMPKLVKIGVPQGSILGPILFLMYINDLPQISHSFSVILYADDTTMMTHNSEHCELIQHINRELPKLYQWLVANRLSLNFDKTFALLFSNRHEAIDDHLEIQLNNNKIKVELFGEFLGLTIDSNVKFINHIENIRNKISRCVGIFYKMKDHVPCKVLVNLYYSLVYPYLLYGNLIWGGTNAHHLLPLQLLQKKLIRIITGSGFLAHTDPLFWQTKILKLNDLHKYLLCLHMFNLKQNNNQIFESIHTYYTRQQNDAQTAFQRLSMSQRSMSYAAPRAWNALPRDMRECESSETFKKQLKSYFINAYV